MNRPVIQIENLGKRYRLGGRARLDQTLPEAVASFAQRALGRGSNTPSVEDDARDLWALRDINLDLHHGEVLGLIGHNGSGKSTLLKILSQITTPTTGRATIRGRVASLLEVGTGFHPELSGRENIYLNGSILGMTGREIRAKFDDIVAFSGVERFLDTPVKRYSSGMTVRLAFAVAAHLDPEILVIDEVLAVGDAEFQKKCLGKMEEVARGEGRTVLFVSHNMAAVQSLCHRAIQLDHGRLVAEGKPSDIVERYLQAFEDESGERTELVDRPRRDGLGDQVRLVNAVVYDSAGRPTQSLKFGEPFDIEVACEGLTDYPNVSLIAGIESPRQGRIATTMTEEAHLRLPVHKGKRTSARLHVDHLSLRPGLYTLTLGIRHVKGGLDHLPNAVSFRVTPLAADDAASHNQRDGMIQIDPNWRVTTPGAQTASPVAAAA